MTRKYIKADPVRLCRFDEASHLVSAQEIFRLLFEEIEKNEKFSEEQLHQLPDTVLADHVLQRQGGSLLCYDHAKGISYRKRTSLEKTVTEDNEGGYYGVSHGEVHGWHIGDIPSRIPIPLQNIVSVAPTIISHYWGKPYHSLPSVVKEKAYVIFPSEEKIWPAFVLVWDYALVADHYVRAYAIDSLVSALSCLHETKIHPHLEESDEEEDFPDYRQTKKRD